MWSGDRIVPRAVRHWLRLRVLVPIGVAGGLAVLVPLLVLNADGSARRGRVSPAFAAGTPASPMVSPTVTPTIQPAAAPVVLDGTVDSVSSSSSFIGTSKSHAGVQIDLSHASHVYPPGHIPAPGDDFYSSGAWSGPMDARVFVVQSVDFNIHELRGKLTRVGVTEPDANYALTDLRYPATWQLIVRPELLQNISSPTLAENPSKMLDLPEGTAVRVIGYQLRPRVLVVTGIELW